jgi:hypothetical protein
LLLYGIGAGPSPDGVREDEVGQSTDAWSQCQLPGLRSDLIRRPGEGTSLREGLVS